MARATRSLNGTNVAREVALLGRSVYFGHANQFLVHEFLDAETGELATVAGVLDASEREIGRRPCRMVHEHALGRSRHQSNALIVMRQWIETLICHVLLLPSQPRC